MKTITTMKICLLTPIAAHIDFLGYGLTGTPIDQCLNGAVEIDLFAVYQPFQGFERFRFE